MAVEYVNKMLTPHTQKFKGTLQKRAEKPSQLEDREKGQKMPSCGSDIETAILNPPQQVLLQA